MSELEDLKRARAATVTIRRYLPLMSPAEGMVAGQILASVVNLDKGKGVTTENLRTRIYQWGGNDYMRYFIPTLDILVAADYLNEEGGVVTKGKEEKLARLSDSATQVVEEARQMDKKLRKGWAVVRERGEKGEKGDAPPSPRGK